jgi:MoxR-like ATPase
VSELPQEKREELGLLEMQADEAYGVWSRLQRFRKRFGPAIVPGNISEYVGLSPAQVEEKLNRSAIEAEVDKLPKNQKKKDVLKKLRLLQAVGAVHRAAADFYALQRTGAVKDAENLDRDLEAFARMRFKELLAAAKHYRDLVGQAEEVEELIDVAHSDPDFELDHPDELFEVERQHEDVMEQIRSLMSESPEAYVYVLGSQLREMKRAFDEHGRILETPYVKQKLERIRQLVQDGRPVFIHGDLGAGKTELAKHAARKFLSEPHLRRWEAVNPPPKGDPEARKRWAMEREAQREALLISGHKTLEVEDILKARVIEKREAVSPEEQTRFINERWDEFKGTLGREATKADRILFEKAYLEYFRAPIETRTVLRPLLEAMQDGRPLIIDEMNAIPHSVLIVMNDLLMRRPGEWVNLPGLVPFQVKDGFTVIATGNYKPEDGLMYIGRQPLDAAFLSRFGLVSYDYLPQQVEIEAEGLDEKARREWRAKNEFLQAMVTRMIRLDGSLTVPEAAFGRGGQLERLAYIARIIQDIFSEREVGEAFYAEGEKGKVKPKKVLKENVLSIRHLLPVLDRWQREGYKRPLDDYLFLDYIARSDARPQEKLYLYKILQTQGDFFPPSQGWPDVTDRKWKDQVLSFPIEARMFEIDPKTRRKVLSAKGRPPLKELTIRDTIEWLYGPVPRRAKVAKEYLEGPKAAKTESAESEEADVEAAELFDAMRKQAEQCDDEFEGSLNL